MQWVLLWMASAMGSECAMTSGESVQVASLNTWGLPYPLSTDRRARFQRISRYLDGDFDVVGLQEVWQSARTLMRKQLRYPTAAGDSGLALYSRLPSTQPVLRPFQAAVGPDRLKSKGLIASQVEVSEDNWLWVVVTHMQAGHTERQQKARAMQVDEVVDYVSELEGPVLVMGDFNLNRRLDSDRDSHQRLQQAGLTDVAQAAGKRRPTYPGSKARLDRIYVRSADGTCVVPEAANVGDDDMSDHLPVQAKLRFHKGHKRAQ